MFSYEEIINTVDSMLDKAGQDEFDEAVGLYEMNCVNVLKNNNIFEGRIDDDGEEVNIVLTFGPNNTCDVDTNCSCGEACYHLYAVLYAIKNDDFIICNDVHFTNADCQSIDMENSNHLLNKGACLCDEDTLDLSVEYYRLAATMGNSQAMTNLGYCYLYGRGVNPSIDLALAYFKMAAKRENIDALYKLGKVHNSDEFGMFDKEMALMYFNEAMLKLRNSLCVDEEYPYLYLEVAKEHMPGGGLKTNIREAYEELCIAKEGFSDLIDAGNVNYKNEYYEVIKLLNEKIFKKIKEEDEFYLDEEDLPF